MMAACGKYRTDPHTCERLHKCIGKMGRRLDVKVTHVPLWVRSSRKRVAQRLVDYPVLLPSDWVDLLFSYGGHFFLGGRSLASPSTITEVEKELEEFWSRYRVIDKDFPMFHTVPNAEWKRCIPIAIHGDEGRGKAKMPVMVMAMQCVLPLMGKRTNMQGRPGLFKGLKSSCFLRSSYCTRLLYTLLPAPYTTGSFFKLLRVLTDNMNSLHEGRNVLWQQSYNTNPLLAGSIRWRNLLLPMDCDGDEGGLAIPSTRICFEQWLQLQEKVPHV